MLCLENPAECHTALLSTSIWPKISRFEAATVAKVCAMILHSIEADRPPGFYHLVWTYAARKSSRGFGICGHRLRLLFQEEDCNELWKLKLGEAGEGYANMRVQWSMICVLPNGQRLLMCWLLVRLPMWFCKGDPRWGANDQLWAGRSTLAWELPKFGWYYQIGNRLNKLSRDHWAWLLTYGERAVLGMNTFVDCFRGLTSINHSYCPDDLFRDTIRMVKGKSLRLIPRAPPKGPLDLGLGW